MTNIEDLIVEIVKFRDERDWSQFHNSKDLALAISIEAAELNELFLWKNSEDVDANAMKLELADVLIFAFLLAKKNSLNIGEIILEKLELNALKYPVKKARGSAKKYTDLQ